MTREERRLFNEYVSANANTIFGVYVAPSENKECVCDMAEFDCERNGGHDFKVWRVNNKTFRCAYVYEKASRWIMRVITAGEHVSDVYEVNVTAMATADC